MTGQRGCAILQPVCADEFADSLGSRELAGNGGPFVHKTEELLLGVHSVFRVDLSIEDEPDATERVDGVGVVIKRDDPHPAAIEDVVKRALAEWIFELVGR